MEKEEELKRQLVKLLEPEAYQRLMSVKIANPQLFEKATQYILQLSMRVGRKLTEQELIQLLRQLRGPDRKTRIEFKRK